LHQIIAFLILFYINHKLHVIGLDFFWVTPHFVLFWGVCRTQIALTFSSRRLFWSGFHYFIPMTLIYLPQQRKIIQIGKNFQNLYLKLKIFGKSSTQRCCNFTKKNAFSKILSVNFLTQMDKLIKYKMYLSKNISSIWRCTPSSF
jgi:hypothetical protein